MRNIKDIIMQHAITRVSLVTQLPNTNILSTRMKWDGTGRSMRLAMTLTPRKYQSSPELVEIFKEHDYGGFKIEPLKLTGHRKLRGALTFSQIYRLI